MLRVKDGLAKIKRKGYFGLFKNMPFDDLKIAKMGHICPVLVRKDLIARNLKQ